MSSIINRSSRLAIVAESTEGTPVLPSSTGDYMVMQSGFSLVPNIEENENNELRGSVAAAKPISGLETPDLSVSHYINHSGTEGQAPEYNLLIKSLFGRENVQSTERTLTSSSTAGSSSARAVLKFASGGTDYSAINSGRGLAVLVKDGPNGYSIRNTYSVSSNDVTLAQNLANAPASGVTCGKFVNYSPADDAHISYTAALYRGNGGALEVAAGCKTTDVSIDITAGQPINASFTASGVGYYFNPIEITASTKYIDITTDDETDVAAVLAVGVYKDPYDLAAAVATAITSAMNGHGDSCACTWSNTTGKFTITATGTSAFSILWNSGSNTANSAAAKLGFSTAADSTSATTYTSATAISFASPNTPAYDSQDAVVAKDAEVMIGDFDDIDCYCIRSATINVSNTKSNLPCVCSDSGVQGSIVTSRVVSVDIVADLTQYDVDKFYRFRTGQETMLTINAGVKSGGNWVAGKCMNFWLARGRISSFSVDDADGVAILNMTITGYGENGEGEAYLNYL